MKKLKTLLLALLSVVCVGAAAVGFASCGDDEETSSSSVKESSSSVEDSSSSMEESSSSDSSD
ncbi:MAG: hypothetical protein IJ393_01850, partial [Clostridia bacterium]|nr:hypothetical protein [Clostridia bacterium]